MKVYKYTADYITAKISEACDAGLCIHRLPVMERPIRIGHHDGNDFIIDLNAVGGGYVQSQVVAEAEGATFDVAVPQNWLNENFKEVNRRGGAVWWYDKADHFGRPMFMDEVEAKYIEIVKAKFETIMREYDESKKDVHV